MKILIHCILLQREEMYHILRIPYLEPRDRVFYSHNHKFNRHRRRSLQKRDKCRLPDVAYARQFQASGRPGKG